MQASNPNVGREDLSTHVGDKLRTDRSNAFIVFLYGKQDVPKLLWNDNAFPLDPGHKFLPRLNRHDPRNDRHIDPRRSNTPDPVDENVNVVKHLRKDEIRAGVDLLLQVLDLLGLCVLTRSRLGMTLRESSDGDVKVVSVFGTDVLDEVDRFGESAGRRGPVGLAVWRVTSECENVLTAGLFGKLHKGLVLRARE